ncbi:unnamed protein product [Meganyctiphanes norvegica]|uniref:Uncharacterized protein n=1 Tax=Meganyctiphanes norvegica TaxID=48144 RepID=A0AAV2RKE7_MEGNR
MLNFVATSLAVSYGYTNLDLVNMEDIDDNECYTVVTNNRRNIAPIKMGAVLPDIIMDTHAAAAAPPSSPLRRAHSYHFVFPVKKHSHPYHGSDTLLVFPSNPDVVRSITTPISNVESVKWDENKNWRNVGKDLQKIADKFHLDHSKIQFKCGNRGEDTMNLAILVSLLCWRLLNKLH